MQANLDKTNDTGPLRHAALEREARSQLQMAVDTLGIDTHPVVDDLLQRGRELAPGIDTYTMNSVPPCVPGEDGKYPVPVPGQYNPFAS